MGHMKESLNIFERYMKERTFQMNIFDQQPSLPLE